jgi:hypothetical protein
VRLNFRSSETVSFSSQVNVGCMKGFISPLISVCDGLQVFISLLKLVAFGNDGDVASLKFFMFRMTLGE